jgi:hypothetical protein
MVNDPLRSTVVQLSRTAVDGKPYTVSEVNHPFPAEHACEGIPILAAYAAMQDWDGVFWYTLGHDHLVGEEPRAIGHFDLGPDPVKMAQLAAGAVMFLRGDVRPARRTVGRSYSTEQVYESIRLPWSESPYFTPGFPSGLALVHAVRITSLDCKENAQSTENLALRIDNPFAAVTLSALDEEPIARSSKLLLTATARVANSGMQWNPARTTLEKWGGPPPLIEPVTGKVVLRRLAGAKSVSYQPLDGAGRPLGPVLKAVGIDRGWELTLGNPATAWCLVFVAR